MSRGPKSNLAVMEHWKDIFPPGSSRNDGSYCTNPRTCLLQFLRCNDKAYPHGIFWRLAGIAGRNDKLLLILLQLGHFHVAGWILNYWPTWRSSRLANRAGRNDTKLEELWCKGYSCRAIFGQNTCRKWKTPGKNTENTWPVKKASPSNWSISYFV